jgi:hypothetical protein
LAGEAEVLGENLPQRRFVHHKFHMTRPGFEPEPPRWENRLCLVRCTNIILISGMLCGLDQYMFTNASDELTAAIFKV